MQLNEVEPLGRPTRRFIPSPLISEPRRKPGKRRSVSVRHIHGISIHQNVVPSWLEVSDRSFREFSLPVCSALGVQQRCNAASVRCAAPAPAWRGPSSNSQSRRQLRIDGSATRARPGSRRDFARALGRARSHPSRRTFPKGRASPVLVGRLSGPTLLLGLVPARVREVARCASAGWLRCHLDRATRAWHRWQHSSSTGAKVIWQIVIA